jgi:hypothetical protein
MNDLRQRRRGLDHSRLDDSRLDDSRLDHSRLGHVRDVLCHLGSSLYSFVLMIQWGLLVPEHCLFPEHRLFTIHRANLNSSNDSRTAELRCADM